ncbi:MAG TPA: zinc-ribbon domain-containing protein, partial [Tepidisphaeraceae bacterium]|nr:zinc-ribbon domain-containing protein [Tepidisphaeraceae bacterium]
LEIDLREKATYPTAQMPRIKQFWETQVHVREFTVPHCPFILVFGILPLIHLALIFRPRWRQSRGVCPTCGYDLRATATLCPECGYTPST